MTGGAEGKAYFRMADPKTGKLMCAVYDIADGKWSSQVTEPFLRRRSVGIMCMEWMRMEIRHGSH